MTDVAVKSFLFLVVRVYKLKCVSERRSFFQRFESFLPGPERIDQVGDWNEMDSVRWAASGVNWCESRLIDLMARYNLVDRL